jgi:hypothetical protein
MFQVEDKTSRNKQNMFQVEDEEASASALAKIVSGIRPLWVHAIILSYPDDIGVWHGVSKGRATRETAVRLIQRWPAHKA